MNIEKELAKRLMDDGESTARQEAYNREINFYETVASGNTKALEERLKNFGQAQKLGKLSTNDLQNNKYHATILAALVSRFCDHPRGSRKQVLHRGRNGDLRRIHSQ